MLITPDPAQVVKAISVWQYVEERMSVLGLKGLSACTERPSPFAPQVAFVRMRLRARGANAIAALRVLRMGVWWALTTVKLKD